MRKIQPDYRHIADAAHNRKPLRMPIYEHIINVGFMEKRLGARFADLHRGDDRDKLEFFRKYAAFFLDHGYDCVSFERSARSSFPGGGALGAHIDPVIKTRADFQRYPFGELLARYQAMFDHDFELLEKALPEGVKCVGGVANGVFECVQDLASYTGLCYMRADDPELYDALFIRVGELLASFWAWFLPRWGHLYAVPRFGDDLGFRTQTLIPEEDIRRLVIPAYKRIVDTIHAAEKPFLLHSCGCIFGVMDDIITKTMINAKHSNEDQIAPFSEWAARYNDRIGLFGGLDLNVLYLSDEAGVRSAVRELIELSKTMKGYALGTGNSIPDDVPVQNFLTMVETANEYRATQE